MDYLDTADLDRYDFVAELPQDDRFRRLEGYIFPDTYQFYLGEDVSNVATVFWTGLSRWWTTRSGSVPTSWG